MISDSLSAYSTYVSDHGVLFTILCILSLMTGMFFFCLFLFSSRKNSLLKKQIEDLAKENFQLSSILEQERKFAEEKQHFFMTGTTEMENQFKVIAENILTQRAGQLDAHSNERLHSVLTPFKEQLHLFKSDIHEMHHQQTQDKAKLSQEIEQLRNLNEKINIEAASLTRALKNDSKTQGVWGELILERVLEASGLEKGREYSTQLSFRDRENNIYRPDALIHLPGKRSIIIDAKVSLTAWEKFINEEQDKQKKNHLAEHIHSIKKHMAGLSAKNYQGLPELQALDFVLMFMPMEAAYSTALLNNPALYEEGMKKNIIIVTPQSLLATIKTIASLWQRVKQNRNAIEITDRASLLYDKFRLFTEDMEKTGDALHMAQHSYDAAFSKLTRGKGNLVGQAKKLVDLGVKAKKKLPEEL